MTDRRKYSRFQRVCANIGDFVLTAVGVDGDIIVLSRMRHYERIREHEQAVLNEQTPVFPRGLIQIRYNTLNDALTAVANTIINDVAANGSIEYGIAIYRDYREVGECFYLTTTRRGAIPCATHPTCPINRTKPESTCNLNERTHYCPKIEGGSVIISDKICGNPIDMRQLRHEQSGVGFRFEAQLHSHPTTNQDDNMRRLSAGDYYESCRNNLIWSGVYRQPFPIYLVTTNINGIWELLRFTPPGPNTVDVQTGQPINNAEFERSRMENAFGNAVEKRVRIPKYLCERIVKYGLLELSPINNISWTRIIDPNSNRI